MHVPCKNITQHLSSLVSLGLSSRYGIICLKDYVFQLFCVISVYVWRTLLSKPLNLFCELYEALSSASKLIGTLEDLTFVWLLDILGFGCDTKASAAISQLAQHNPIRQADVCSLTQMASNTSSHLLWLSSVFEELAVIFCSLSLSPYKCHCVKSYSVPAVNL